MPTELNIREAADSIIIPLAKNYEQAGRTLFPNATPGDSDGDGIPDWYEAITAGLNPNDPSDALLDFNKDGKTNLAQFRMGEDIWANTALARIWDTQATQTLSRSVTPKIAATAPGLPAPQPQPAKTIRAQELTYADS